MLGLRTPLDRKDLLSLCGPGAGLCFAFSSWFLYFKIVGGPAPTVVVFFLVALAWGATWKFARGSLTVKTARAFLASVLAVVLLGHAAFLLPRSLVSFLQWAAVAALLCLCCGADEARRRFSFADAISGALTLTLGAAALAMFAETEFRAMHIVFARLPLVEKLGLAVMSGSCGLAAWGSVLYLVRGLELGLSLGTEYALSAAAGFAAAALLEKPGAVSLIIACTALPAALLAISRGLRRLRKRRADVAMEGERR